jgi:hypothetical protein
MSSQDLPLAFDVPDDEVKEKVCVAAHGRFGALLSVKSRTRPYHCHADVG